MPQPNLVPVSKRDSRNTHNKGVSPSTSTDRSAPFTLISIMFPQGHKAPVSFHRLKFAINSSWVPGGVLLCDPGCHDQAISGSSITCLSISSKFRPGPILSPTSNPVALLFQRLHKYCGVI